MQGSNKTVKFEKTRKLNKNEDFQSKGRKLNKTKRGNTRWDDEQ